MTKRKIEIGGDVVCFGKGGLVPLDYFPHRFRAALKNFDDIIKDANCHTRRLEQEGARLDKNKFRDIAEVSQFLDRVIRWGGSMGNKIFWMIEEHKSRPAIVENIPRAAELLHKGALSAALEIITEPKGLGISFGSKILRMLNPEKVGVYDSVLYEHLPYPYTIPGWDEFCRDCKAVAEELERRGIKNSERDKGEWFAADVEAVIFDCFHVGKPDFKKYPITGRKDRERRFTWEPGDLLVVNLRVAVRQLPMKDMVKLFGEETFKKILEGADGPHYTLAGEEANVPMLQELYGKKKFDDIVKPERLW